MENSPLETRLDRRLTVAFGALTGALLVLLGLAAVTTTAYTFEQERASFVDAIAASLADSAESVGFSGKYHTRHLFEDLVDESDALVFLSLVDPDRKVLAHSDPSQNDAFLAIDDVLTADQIAAGDPQKVTRWHGDVWITEIRVPIHGGFQDKVIGVLHVGVRTQTWWQRLAPTALPILGLTLFLLGLAVPIFQRMSRHFAGPVQQQALQLNALLARSPLYISVRDGDRILLESDLLTQARARSAANTDAIHSLLSAPSAAVGEVVKQRLILDGAARILVSTRFPIELPGGAIERVWIASDTTALQHIAEQRDRFASAVAASPEAIALVSAKGIIDEVNPAFTDVLGFTLEEALGLPMWELLVGGNSAHTDEIQAALASGVPWRGVLQLKHVRGERSPFMVGLVALEDGGVAITARDVARELTLQEQLQHSQKMEAVGRLAGGVAHDFNNLLTVILMVAELFKLRPNGDPGFQEDVQSIVSAAERGKELTSQLLSFGRRRPRHPEALSVASLVDESVPMVRRVLTEGLDIARTVPSDLWPVFADPGQLQQVLMNLCFNAKDAIKDGGMIRVEASNHPADAQAELPVDEVEIRVVDNGHGIAADLLQRICEPFFTTKPMGEGTGLGLSIVHGIVEQNGGRLVIESEVGVGTTVRVFLPRHHGEVRQTAIASPNFGALELILVVDDEPDVCMAIARTLRGAGYNVETANSAQAAISLLERGPLPDAVLTDLAMPQVSGAELGQVIGERWPKVGVGYMSGFGTQFPEIEGLPFTAKPPTAQALRVLVHQVLERSASVREQRQDQPNR